MGNIITQQCVFYKCNVTNTIINMYGEASNGRYFEEPVLFNALIDVGDQTAPTANDMVGFDWPVTFKFLRDDLVDANLQPNVGDIIMWQNAYWEIDNENIVQFFVGKDPRRRDNPMEAYHCPHCGYWHVGHATPKQKNFQRSPKK
jgi:hypothetical protein